MKLLIKICLPIFILFGFLTLAQADSDPVPLAQLKSLATQMTGELDKHQNNLKNNDKLVNDIVVRILLPHFDLVGVSRSVVNRDAWQSADPNLQKEFTQEFTNYIIRTYSSALASYEGEKIKFYPLRSFDPSQPTVQIYSDIIQKDAPPIPVSYRLKNQNNDWIIYDFSVEGISLVQNYRSQFASALQKGGLTELVKELKTHNQSLK